MGLREVKKELTNLDKSEIIKLISEMYKKIPSVKSYLDVFVSSFKNKDILCKTLAWYARPITKAINKEIKIYKMPKLRFRYDESWEISQNIINTINNL